MFEYAREMPSLGTSNYCVLCYRLMFPEHKLPQKRKLATREELHQEKEEDDTLLVEPYTIPNRGPYPYNQPKK